MVNRDNEVASAPHRWSLKSVRHIGQSQRVERSVKWVCNRTPSVNAVQRTIGESQSMTIKLTPIFLKWASFRNTKALLGRHLSMEKYKPSCIKLGTTEDLFLFFDECFHTVQNCWSTLRLAPESICWIPAIDSFSVKIKRTRRSGGYIRTKMRPSASRDSRRERRLHKQL